MYAAGNTDHASCVAFSPCGLRLLSGGEAGALRLWELNSSMTGRLVEGADAAIEVERNEAYSKRRRLENQQTHS